MLLPDGRVQRASTAILWCNCSERQLRPHVRHRTLAERTSGLDFGQTACSERPLRGNCAALRIRGRRLDRSLVASFAAIASGCFVRRAAVRH